MDQDRLIPEAPSVILDLIGFDPLDGWTEARIVSAMSAAYSLTGRRVKQGTIRRRAQRWLPRLVALGVLIRTGRMYRLARGPIRPLLWAAALKYAAFQVGEGLASERTTAAGSSIVSFVWLNSPPTPRGRRVSSRRKPAVSRAVAAIRSTAALDRVDAETVLLAAIETASAHPGLLLFARPRGFRKDIQ